MGYLGDLIWNLAWTVLDIEFVLKLIWILTTDMVQSDNNIKKNYAKLVSLTMTSANVGNSNWAYRPISMHRQEMIPRPRKWVVWKRAEYGSMAIDIVPFMLKETAPDAATRLLSGLQGANWAVVNHLENGKTLLKTPLFFCPFKTRLGLERRPVLLSSWELMLLSSANTYR